MERRVVAVGVLAAEQLERPGLGGRGEGEEARGSAAVHARPPCAARASCGSAGASRGLRGLREPRAAPRRMLAPRAAFRSLAASPVWEEWASSTMTANRRCAEVGDLVEDERELLERRDDDPRLLAGEGGGELGAVLVDPGDDAGRVLELVDRLLELAVEDHPVGDDDDLVEDGLVVGRRGGDISRWASQAIVLLLPEPAQCWTRYEWPGTLGAGGRLQPADGVPLVVAGEDAASRLELRRRASRPRRG